MAELPVDLSTSVDLSHLFTDPKTFISADTFRRAGFLVRRASDHNIMVGSHPMLPGYLIKKYSDRSERVSFKAQIDNYRRRIEGAQRVASLIGARGLRHITVPAKVLYRLPDAFSSHGQPSFALIVTEMMLLDGDATSKRYRRIDKETLKELCLVLATYRGLDSAIHNVRFTESGQIAFIDTENWNRRKKRKLGFIKEHLTKKSRKLAKRYLKKFR